jgi:hypothetical protein
MDVLLIPHFELGYIERKKIENAPPNISKEMQVIIDKNKETFKTLHLLESARERAKIRAKNKQAKSASESSSDIPRRDIFAGVLQGTAQGLNTYNRQVETDRIKKQRSEYAYRNQQNSGSNNSNSRSSSNTTKSSSQEQSTAALNFYYLISCRHTLSATRGENQAVNIGKNQLHVSSVKKSKQAKGEATINRTLQTQLRSTFIIKIKRRDSINYADNECNVYVSPMVKPSEDGRQTAKNNAEQHRQGYFNYPNTQVYQID